MVKASKRPFVSVIIPTSGRPLLLKRAIDSCLSGAYASVTEVIVIANGPDVTWEPVRDFYLYDNRVRFYYSRPPNQNIARNIGLEKAEGELIRYLDDDDYLYPNAAANQYHLMELDRLDACSAAVGMVDEDGKQLGTLSQPQLTGLVEASVCWQRLQLPHAHVYRRQSISSLRWKENIRQSEDIVWLIEYAVATERKWCRIDEVVGVWYQHRMPRMSLDRPSGRVHEYTAECLIKATETLRLRSAITPPRASLISEALWACILRAFVFRPFYWTHIARVVTSISSSGRPPDRLFTGFLGSRIDPLILLWLALPIRIAIIAFRFARGVFLGWNYRRTL